MLRAMQGCSEQALVMLCVPDAAAWHESVVCECWSSLSLSVGRSQQGRDVGGYERTCFQGKFLRNASRAMAQSRVAICGIGNWSWYEWWLDSAQIIRVCVAGVLALGLSPSHLPMLQHEPGSACASVCDARRIPR
jgi:hypothetical protein